MTVTVTPFNTGLQKGLRVEVYDAAVVADKSFILDLQQYFDRGFLKSIGSISMFCQYGRLQITDNSSLLKIYANQSTLTCYPISSRGSKYTLAYSKTFAGVVPMAFEMTFYESVQPTYANVILLP